MFNCFIFFFCFFFFEMSVAENDSNWKYSIAIIKWQKSFQWDSSNRWSLFPSLMFVIWMLALTWLFLSYTISVSVITAEKNIWRRLYLKSVFFFILSLFLNQKFFVHLSGNIQLSENELIITLYCTMYPIKISSSY